MLVILEWITQTVFNNIPVHYSLYSKEFFDLAFWLIPTVSLVVLVFAFIFMVFPYKPKGKDYYQDEDG